ncbi:M24 family metallopeptidase [Novosphingobium mangrovi (ex Hu et al. 2023)]|uniref:M24 family metallopeptidase n=1 Tax=Novosphingobium mangrovi (ex Hu et al. 2023) TaxID=2930094 RepID=A0ABT0AER5_9SPHN|nr:M24 family metallopeptidase [Novosphingobium mangrovi (ex Hu et al. 2023)]MCJ1961687.1 M24 family metallopeptidase [Novosphingobium mangrovi (ex Hu et al. 2023)]
MLINRPRADTLMDRDGIDVVVASTPINTFYLSSWATDASWGFGDLALAILPRDHARDAAVLTVEVDMGQPQQGQGTWMAVRGYARKPGIGAGGVQGALTAEGLPQNHQEAVAQYLREMGLERARVAFEDRGLGLDVQTLLGGTIEICPARDLLRDMRMVKTPAEMARMRAAARKTELALEVAAEAVAAGASCAEAERVFWSAAALAGGRPVFLLITPYRPAFGRLPKNAPLLPGDMVTFDATAEFDHYTSDIGRTAVIGEPNPEQLKRYNATRLGWRASLPHFRPGALSSDVEKAVVECIKDHGNPDFKAAGLHSVGLEHTDHPHPGGGMHAFELVDNMVLSCDLPWIGPGIGKFHFEDIIYLDGERVEILNDADGRLLACIDGRTVRVD